MSAELSSPPPATAGLSRGQKVLPLVGQLLLGSLFLWYGWRGLGVERPVWALVSLIIVTEPDHAQARANFAVRLLNTAVGCAIATAALWLFGATLLSLLLAMVAATLAGTLVRNYPESWRLAPTTAVLLIGADHSSRLGTSDLGLIGLRAAEVLTGGAVAVGLAFLGPRLPGARRVLGR